MGVCSTVQTVAVSQLGKDETLASDSGTGPLSYGVLSDLPCNTTSSVLSIFRSDTGSAAKLQGDRSLAILLEHSGRKFNQCLFFVATAPGTKDRDAQKVGLGKAVMALALIHDDGLHVTRRIASIQVTCCLVPHPPPSVVGATTWWR